MQKLSSYLLVIFMIMYWVLRIIITLSAQLGALYLALYGIYFGGDLTEKLRIITSGETLTMDQMACGFFSLIGIILALAVLIDLLFDKGRKIHPVDKKTDWFYKNEQFDRELDDRADKNNYRTL